MKAAEALRREEAAYANGEERPVGGYSLLMSVYAALTLLFGLVVRRKRALPDRIGAGDLALVAVATHKLSRLVTKDTVLAPVRAPFTEFKEAAGSGEVNEEVRGTGLRHAIGELVTCPFCIAVWVSTALAFGLVLAPRATRLVASVLTAVTASDFLQLAYAKAQQATEA
jgi:hypothetical protein